MMHPSRTPLIATLLLTALAGTALGQTSDESKALSAELIADAANRSSLLADDTGSGGGWAKGKFFMGDGGANVLNFGGYSQFRFLANSRENQPNSEDFTSGFQIRRTRLVASGSVWEKNLTFSVVGDVSRSNGSFTLVDAFGKYAWDNGTYVKWGQYKLPLLREESISDIYQLTVERSVVNATFSQNRSQGVEFGYAQKEFRMMADLSDGLNTLNTDFNSGAEADFALTARGDWIFWKDGDAEFKGFDDNTSWKGAKNTGMFGAAVHYQSGGETGFTTDTDIFQATADVSLEGDGWNAFVAGIWRRSEPAAGTSTDDMGVVAQAGFFVSDQAELFGRYDVVMPDNGSDFNTVTAGVNYFFTPHSHALKFTADVLYFIDATTGTPIISGNNTGVPYLSSADDGSASIRMQMQFIF